MWKELAELLNSQGIGEYRSEEKWRKAEDTVEVIQIVSYDEPREPVTTPTPITMKTGTLLGAARMQCQYLLSLGSFTPPRPSTPLKPPLHQNLPQSPTGKPPHNLHLTRGKTPITLPEYFIMCEENARKYNKERERMALELERERIRQRDIELRQRDTELQLQAQWLEFMKVALNVLDKYFSNKH
ncbi:unnamed protein product, partial [Brenthis ino]